MSHRTAYLHGLRVALGGLLFIAVLLPQADVRLTAPTEHGVLAYATSMSRGDLVAGTNIARASNGLGSLAENSQLDASAQAKAQHMIDNNYWAHTAPDGTQPWFFFDQAGYSYIAAGENLAYGFGTSAETITAWMNSAGHRANILGDYADVGFGIANGASYQGGQFTVVVAHYGKTAQSTIPAPLSATPTPMPTPAPAVPAPSPTPAPVPQAPAAPIADIPAATPSPTASTPDKELAPIMTPAVTTASPQSISAWQLLLRGTLPFTIALSLTLVLLAAFGFVVTHIQLMHRAIAVGEHFLVVHPGIDASLIVGALGVILSMTMGRI